LESGSEVQQGGVRCEWTSFGAATWDEDKVVYSAGSWSRDCGEESSNWREAENPTWKAEVSAAKGRLKDKELWVFTDNWSYEGAFFKGCSTKETSAGTLTRT